MTSRPVGLTRDAGFQIGVSRSVAVPLEQVWDTLVSDAGVRTWLGADVQLPSAAGAPPAARPRLRFLLLQRRP